MFHVKHPKINIQIHREYPIFYVPEWKRIQIWLQDVIKKEGKILGFLNIVLVQDESLLKINKETFSHNYYTDIITFDLSDSKDIIEGDLYISYDRIKENAKVFHVKRILEIRRVFVHGVLHLIGYNDKTKKQKLIMRQKEHLYLSIFTTN